MHLLLLDHRHFQDDLHIHRWSVVPDLFPEISRPGNILIVISSIKPLTDNNHYPIDPRRLPKAVDFSSSSYSSATHMHK
jgi:hypothetical protein